MYIIAHVDYKTQLLLSNWNPICFPWKVLFRLVFGLRYRYLPLNPNMDNPNSRIIQSSVETTSQSPQCYSARLIRKKVFVRIRRDPPVLWLFAFFSPTNGNPLVSNRTVLHWGGAAGRGCLHQKNSQTFRSDTLSPERALSMEKTNTFTKRKFLRVTTYKERSLTWRTFRGKQKCIVVLSFQRSHGYCFVQRSLQLFQSESMQLCFPWEPTIAESTGPLLLHHHLLHCHASNLLKLTWPHFPKHTAPKRERGKKEKTSVSARQNTIPWCPNHLSNLKPETKWLATKPENHGKIETSKYNSNTISANS